MNAEPPDAFRQHVVNTPELMDRLRGCTDDASLLAEAERIARETGMRWTQTPWLRRFGQRRTPN